MINRTLTKLGYSVVSAGYGQSALDQLDKNPDIAMLLCDISRPGGMDGVEFIDQALLKRPDIRFLFISGNPSQALAGREGRFDANHVLSKPFRKFEVSERVRSILGAN